MKTQLDEFYPQDGVEIVERDGSAIVRLVDIKSIERTPGTEEGQDIITANVVQTTLPAGIEKADILANFDYYFAKAEKEELSKALALKVAHVERLLKSTDYKALKVADGAMTATEYAPWKRLRAHWRDTVNKMQACKNADELDAVRWAETVEGLMSLG